MPFNSNSYYRNKYRRKAKEYLAEARRVNDPARVAHCVHLARLNWKSYMGYRRMDECDADLKKRLAGQMSHADFMAKWGPLP